ncbi:MAG: RidA family protein [Henriciella sp.]|nr:RidA family protein [Henriciella sp.]
MDISKIPLSPIVEHESLLILSGQLAFTTPGVLVQGGIAEQTHQVMTNIAAILKSRGAGLSDILKMTIWLTDKADFLGFNKAYGAFFEPGTYPARSTVVSQLLIDGALIEIEAIAKKR